jgi:hypothetical protein
LCLHAGDTSGEAHRGADQRQAFYPGRLADPVSVNGSPSPIACGLCLARLALFFSSAIESALEPSRVSGRTEPKTYGKSAGLLLNSRGVNFIKQLLENLSRKDVAPIRGYPYNLMAYDIIFHNFRSSLTQVATY